MASTKITALYECTKTHNDERIRRLKNNMEVFARRNHYENIRHFSDNGTTPHDASHPGFDALMQEAQAGHVGTVLFRTIDDLPPEQYRKLKKAGVRLVDIARLTRQREIVRRGLMQNKSKTLPLHIRDSGNGLAYELHGDYYYPVLLIPAEEKAQPLGKWGMMHEMYLRENRPALYANLMLSGKLPGMLSRLDEQAKERWQTLFEDLCRAEGIDEKLKDRDQMEWIRRTGNAISRCDEIIKAELIFC